MVMAPELSLRGRFAPVAISQYPVGSWGSYRRNRSCLPEIATAPLGPRNDKSGNLAPRNPYCNTCNCQWRSMSALQGGNTYGTNSLAQCHQVCHCEEAAGRRGNLAVPDQITGKPSAKTQLPSRDCHVASLLAMTRQVVPWCISALLRLNCLVQGAHYPQGARRIRKAAKPPTAAQ